MEGPPLANLTLTMSWRCLFRVPLSCRWEKLIGGGWTLMSTEFD
jgi:hypothetical protein